MTHEERNKEGWYPGTAANPGGKWPRKVARNIRPFDNTYRPGIEESDLVHRVHGFQVNEPPAPIRCLQCCREVHCLNCGWNVKCLGCRWHIQHELQPGVTDSSVHTAARVRVPVGDDYEAQVEDQPLCPNCSYKTQCLWCGRNAQCRTCGWDVGHEQVQLGQKVARLDVDDDAFCQGDPAQYAQHTLCHNCGWTAGHEESVPGYTSRVKVSYLRANAALWELGGPEGAWFLRDETNEKRCVWRRDYAIQQLIRKEQPSLPLVDMLRIPAAAGGGGSGADDKFHFTLMARAKGVRADEAYWTLLTDEDRLDVMRDLKRHLRSLRQMTRPQMGSVEGERLKDVAIGSCTGRGCIPTGSNEEEWLENLTPALRRAVLWELWCRERTARTDAATRAAILEEGEEKVRQLKAAFPRSRGGPYVMTHGDLRLDQLFLSNDNEEKKWSISAWLDWETAGFFPWWAERLHCTVGHFLPKCDLGEGDESPCTFLHPGYTEDDWKKIQPAVEAVRKAWFAGGNHTVSRHGHAHANTWSRRKPFCACQPYTPLFREDDIAYGEDHVDIYRIDSSDSDDDHGSEQFDKNEREFERWLWEVSQPPAGGENPETA